MVRNMALGMTITIGIALTVPVAMAQQKQHVSYNTPATQTTYTQQHIVDIGDVPGHQARLFEIQRTYGNAHDSPHFHSTPKVLANTGSSASMAVKRSIKGDSRACGILGIRS
jgi:hypothetical protein